jgi:hypothetical protein
LFAAFRPEIGGKGPLTVAASDTNAINDASVRNDGYDRIRTVVTFWEELIKP